MKNDNVIYNNKSLTSLIIPNMSLQASLNTLSRNAEDKMSNPGRSYNSSIRKTSYKSHYELIVS